MPITIAIKLNSLDCFISFIGDSPFGVNLNDT